MTDHPSRTFTVDDGHTGTILTALRGWLPGQSWSAVRKLLRARRVAINGVLCLDEARRLKGGESVTLVDEPLPPPPTSDDVAIRFVSRDLVVVEKPSGMLTLRRSSERNWSQQRRDQQPTLDEAVPRLITRRANTRGRPALFPVHRIDRDTSGLLVFARNETTQQHLIEQFARHKALRKYLAIIPGRIADQTIRSQLIRDRGDGLRGSTTNMKIGEHAVTHVTTLRQLGEYCEIECRLETGRTNQIRIHLAELGHPVCGDIKYRGPIGEPVDDHSRCPRLALHAAELKFVDRRTGEPMHFGSRWPKDMQVHWRL